MSIATIRKILETELASVMPKLETAYENKEMRPTAGAPYQRVYLLTAAPDNPEIGPGYTEQGIFQVNLFYPLDAGPGDVTTRAELIRDHFPFAASFASSGVTVNITATPEIGPARTEDDRFMVPVKVRFQARIGG